MTTARALSDLAAIRAALPALEAGLIAAADAALGAIPLVRERSGGSGGHSDPTASLALDPRASAARSAHQEAIRSAHAAAVAIETAQSALARAWRYADVPEPLVTYSHLPPTRRAELDELAELNSRAGSIVLQRGA
jgi:hypothetical protein